MVNNHKSGKVAGVKVYPRQTRNLRNHAACKCMQQPCDFAGRKYAP